MMLARKIRKLLNILATGDWCYVQALYSGVAAAIEHEAVLRRLGQCNTVVDIGANRGQFSLAARHCFPSAQVIAFEPLAGPASVFRGIFAGDERVTIHEAAVGPEQGTATIHVSARDDSSSLLPITARQNAIFPGTSETGVATIKVGLLADFMSPDVIGAPALLKLDVQGFELQALSGCADFLDRFAYVYVECSFIELYSGQSLADEIIAWLRMRRFGLSGVYNISYDCSGLPVQADFLFMKAGDI